MKTKSWSYYRSNVFSNYHQITYKDKVSAGIGWSKWTFGLGFKVDKYSFSWDLGFIYGGVEW